MLTTQRIRRSAPPAALAIWVWALAWALPLGAVDATLLDQLRPGHPRLLIETASEAARIARLQAGTAPRLAQLIALLRADAATLAAAPTLTRTVIDGRLLDVSRDLVQRTLTLGQLWRLTGDTAARDRLISDLLAVAAFSDWNPESFLDVAEMTCGVGLGYDWLHDQLTSAQRLALVTAIRDKGLKPGNKESLWWVSSTSNWNQVCHGGLVVGALAIGDLEPALARSVIDRARRKHALALAVYEPDGVYPEGPGSYWPFGTHYSVLMDQALSTAAGLDWGLWARPGFLRSFAFIRHATGPTGLAFNFADGRENAPLPACAAWASVRTGDPSLNAWAWNHLGTAKRNWLTPLLGLVDEPDPATPLPAALPTAWVGRGEVSLATIRSDWSASGAYVGLKAGRLRINHGMATSMPEA